MSTFDKAFAIVVGEEGGITNDAGDPGGLTKYGISQRAYPTVNIETLTLAQAKAIYDRDYWTPIQGDLMTPIVAMTVFDAAVNSGVYQANEWLQQVVGAYVDGESGPKTLHAVDLYDDDKGADALAAEFNARRLMFLTALPEWREFGRGWARRICNLPRLAATLTQGA